MLAGAPGNGKTTLAEVLAYELMYPLFVVRYETLVGSYLGETSSRLKHLMDYAKTQRCVLFFDEFETLGKERGDTHETGEIKRVVISLLLQIDDLPDYVVVVAASNHPELLDRAVWRRFQLRIELPMPTRQQLTRHIESICQRCQTNFGYDPETLAKLVFPRARTIDPPKGKPFPRSKPHFPGHARQVERLSQQLDELQQNFSRYKASVSGVVAGLEPETVLVIEIAESVDDFRQAVESADGLEWLGERDVEDIEPDDDFYEVPQIGVDFFKNKIDGITNRAQSKEIREILKQHGFIDDDGKIIADKIKVYHLAIMQPNPQARSFGGHDEHFPDEVFFEDRIERAVRRMFEGEGNVPAQAPGIKIINLSIGDPERPFIHTPSPWARLLDWLSWKYRVLFCVSAGNFGDDIEIGIPHCEFSALSDEHKVVHVLKCIEQQLSKRRLLSPAESLNSLTVGALHADESGSYSLGQRTDLLPIDTLFSPISRFGHGFRRSIKPEILFPGGRQLYMTPHIDLRQLTTRRPSRESIN